MIKATELRIGNWVINCLGEQCQVEKTDLYIEANDSMSPIPLTPEILEKAGFEKDKDGTYVRNKCLYIVADVLQIALGYAPVLNCPCKYVHQLQNLYFSLTGEELEIKL